MLKNLHNLFLAVLFIPQLASANDRISFAYGESTHDSTPMYYVAYQKSWDDITFETEHSVIETYWNFAVSFWDHSDDEAAAISVSPVFRLRPNTPDSALRPFVDFGIGPSIVSETKVGNRDLDTAFQIHNQLGLGVEKDSHSFSINYHHWSNASIGDDNDGMDFVGGTYTFGF